MFFTEIHLKKDHWSFKLLKWAFNLPRFNNFCPHFWLTILAIILSPFIGFGKIFMYLLSKLVEVGETFSNYLERVGNERADKAARKILDANLLTDVELKGLVGYYATRYDRNYRTRNKLKFYTEHTLDSCKVKKLQKYYNIIVSSNYGKSVLYNLITKHSTNFDYFNNLLQEVIIDKPVKQYKESVPLKNKPWWPKAIIFAKILAVPFLIVGVIVILFLLYHASLMLGYLGYWVIHGLIFAPWKTILEAALLAITVIIVGAWLLWLLARLSDKIKYSSFSTKNCIICRTVKKILFWPFIFLWSGTVSVCTFLWNAFLMFKQNNCPAIIWDDEEK